MAGYEGFVETLVRNVARNPGKPAVVFCRGNSDGHTEQSLSYEDLHTAARATAVRLRARFRPGDRILLLFPQGLGFVTSFVGCLYAGMLPVAAPIPQYRAHADRATAVALDAQVSIVLTDEASRQDVAGLLETSPLAGAVRTVDDIGIGTDPADWTPPATDETSLAFLQYTSGSTSDPRGVMVTQGNLEHNIRLLRDSFGWGAEDRFCSWLPTYHDMGLVAMLLCPLYLASTLILLPPGDFLRRPQLWLRLMGAYRATASSAPNFAYELCARRLTDAQIDQLDLSSIRAAANGSEPISAATLARFAERFDRAGFRPEMFAPGYGLAEATLCVSGTFPGQRPVIMHADPRRLEKNEVRPAPADGRSRALVSSGRPGDLDVRIVDPKAREELQGRIGEIWVAGGSVTAGYWRRPQDTERTFQAVTSSGEGPFLRTGDLGMVMDGELFITGRIKEMLIINGRNLYPHDIERDVQQLDEAFAGRPGCVFAVPVAGEEIVVVQEIRASRDEGELAELCARIRTGLWPLVGVRVANVLLVKAGAVAKTTSGKIQRAVMRDLFRDGRLQPLHADIGDATRAWLGRPAQPEPAQPEPVRPEPSLTAVGSVPRSGDPA